MVKVLIPTGGFFPAETYGGPVVSIYNLCNLLADEIDFVIVTSNHELNDTKPLLGLKNGWNDKYKAKIYYLNNSEINYRHFYKIVEKEKPDWIYINSLFDYKNCIPFLKIAKRTNTKVLLAPRGQLNKGAFKKRYKKIPYIWFVKHLCSKVDIVFQSTCNEESEALSRYFNKYDKVFLPNVPSVPATRQIKKKEKNELKIVFFSRIHQKKNLKFALLCLSNLKGSIFFDIYGPIEDKQYWSECCEMIKKLPNNIAVNYKGIVRHDDIFATLSAYHLFLFPTFSENYGHVIAEALFSGIPVLISNNTPWTGVNENGAGKAIPLDDLDAYVAFIREFIKMDNSTFQVYSTNAFNYAFEISNIESLKKQYKSLLINECYEK